MADNPFKREMSEFEILELQGKAYNNGFLDGCKAAIIDPKTIGIILAAITAQTNRAEGNSNKSIKKKG